LNKKFHVIIGFHPYILFTKEMIVSFSMILGEELGDKSEIGE
jgi:hypothetical protein